MKKATTIQEKRALRFAVELLTKHGYGYTINVPSRELANELTQKGAKISFMTVKREMTARINGVTYYLNRYAFNKLINAQ